MGCVFGLGSQKPRNLRDVFPFGRTNKSRYLHCIYTVYLASALQKHWYLHSFQHVAKRGFYMRKVETLYFLTRFLKQSPENCLNISPKPMSGSILIRRCSCINTHQYAIALATRGAPVFVLDSTLPGHRVLGTVYILCQACTLGAALIGHWPVEER